MSLSVLLAGGGSAGHVSPLLALADALVRQDPATRVTCLGTAQGLEARLVPQHGYRLLTIPKVPMPRRPGSDLARLPARLQGAVRAAGAAITSSQADVVVGFGGYVCPPAYLAARRSHVPIVIHEQNPLPGLANRLGARLTPYVAVTFAGTPLPHAVHTGMPLRRQITQLRRGGGPPSASVRARAREKLGLEPDRPTLVVIGGSLGAQRLNETFGAASAGLRAAGVQVLHASGAGKTVDVAPLTPGEPRYVVREYLDHIEDAYAAADLVVCRSGASTVCELTAVGLPAVYVPLPVGNGEQRLNAELVVAAGGGLLVEDADMTPGWVVQHLLPLLADPARLETMARGAGKLGMPDADDRLAALVIAAAEGRPAVVPAPPAGSDR
jgi:UDP-N-acetylglucosamine--N-acetylmuramyl-(pentapeptide) pyrophosphoryl-undecaprenol N-acetylglucosamine transferase